MGASLNRDGRAPARVTSRRRSPVFFTTRFGSSPQQRCLVLRLLVLSVVTAVLASPLDAQSKTSRVGVGVSLDVTPTGEWSLFEEFRFPGRTGNIHVPIQVSRNLRLEPMLGYAHEHQRSTSGGSSLDVSATLWRLGIGVLYQLPAKGDFRAYAGARLGLRHRSQKLRQEDPSFPTATSKAWQNDKFLAAVFGGEFFLSPHFSLGGEAQLSYTDLGDIKLSQTPPNPFPPTNIGESGSELETAGLVTVRWYP